MHPSNRKSETTYATIVETGLNMAALDGIGQLSLGEVAKKMGISKSGVFARVGSLRALHEAVLDEFDRRFVADVLTPSLALPQGLPRLHAQVAAWIGRACDTRPTSACLYAAGAFEFDDRDTPLRDRLGRGVLRWRASMRQTVIQAIGLGHLRSDTDPEQLAFEIYSLILGAMHDARFMRDSSTEQRMHNAVGRLLANYTSLTYTA